MYNTQGPSRGSPTDLDLEKVNVRGREFSELLSQWRIPLDTANFVASTSTGPGMCGTMNIIENLEKKGTFSSILQCLSCKKGFSAGQQLQCY